MTEKRFQYYETSEDTQIWDSQRNAFYDDFDLDKITECLNTLHEENEQLKQYKQAVSDVLLSYSQKNLSAKQLGLLTAIMHELGVFE